MLQQSCLVLYQMIPFFRWTTKMPVLTHVVKIPQSLYFHNRQLNVRFSKLNYDDGSKYGFIQNETFLDNLSFSYIVIELLLVSKQKKCKSHIHHRWVCMSQQQLFLGTLSCNITWQISNKCICNKKVNNEYFYHQISTTQLSQQF